MKLLINKANVDGPTSDYPRGVVRDKTLSIAGSRLNVEMFGDITQFFEKMFADSGITANGLPDNVTNTFQLYEALKKVTQPDWSTTPISYPLAIWASLGGGLYTPAVKLSVNEIALCGAITGNAPAPGTFNVIQLALGFRPSSTVTQPFMVERAGVKAMELLVIDTGGNLIVSTASAVTIKVWLDGITFRI